MVAVSDGTAWSSGATGMAWDTDIDARPRPIANKDTTAIFMTFLPIGTRPYWHATKMTLLKQALMSWFWTTSPMMAPVMVMPVTMAPMVMVPVVVMPVMVMPMHQHGLHLIYFALRDDRRLNVDHSGHAQRVARDRRYGRSLCARSQQDRARD